MQAYGESFARVYNVRWAAFAMTVAPKLEQLFTENSNSEGLPLSLLDVCCGTGQLANYFLAKGYTVLGIDLSKHMIQHAIENNRMAVDSGNAVFIVEDATAFHTKQHASAATCVYDAMNDQRQLELRPNDN